MQHKSFFLKGVGIWGLLLVCLIAFIAMGDDIHAMPTTAGFYTYLVTLLAEFSLGALFIRNAKDQLLAEK